MGILSKSTVAHLQSNEYAEELLKKAGIPGIHGCIDQCLFFDLERYLGLQTEGNRSKSVMASCI